MQSLVNAMETDMDAITEDICKVLVNWDTLYAYTLEEYLMDKKNLCVVRRYTTYFCQQVARHLPYIDSRRYNLNLNKVDFPIISLNCYDKS